MSAPDPLRDPRGRTRLRILPFVIVTSASLLAVRGLGLVVDRPPAGGRDAPSVTLPIVTPALAARGEAPGSARPAVNGAVAAAAAGSFPESAASDRRDGPSAAELSVLEELRARRHTLDERERTLAEREALLVAAERRLAARVDEIAALQGRLEALDRAAREREDAGWRGLVRIYEQMRPRDAARIFNELEMSVLLEVVARMRERIAAPILAGMEPEKAKALTAELAQRRARPGGDAASGG